MRLTEEYMTTSEAARLLGSHLQVVSHMCSRGLLPAEKIAYRWLIPRAFVEEFSKTYVPRRGHPRMKRKYTKRSPKWFQKEAQ